MFTLTSHLSVECRDLSRGDHVLIDFSVIICGKIFGLHPYHASFLCMFLYNIPPCSGSNLRTDLVRRLPSRLDAIRNADAPNARADDLHPSAPSLAHYPPQLPHASGVPHEVRRNALLVPVHGVVHRRRKCAAQMLGYAWQHCRDELRVRRRRRRRARGLIRPTQHRRQLGERRRRRVVVLLWQAGRVEHDAEQPRRLFSFRPWLWLCSCFCFRF